jgi:predicted MFS family arabinose efflux permease
LLLQGWRLCYYGAGVVGLIITFLTAFTLREPERQTIGEESGVNANNAVVGEEEEPTSKSGQWKVMLQPRVIMLCIAASIRHTGKHYGSESLASKSQLLFKCYLPEDLRSSLSGQRTK